MGTTRPARLRVLVWAALSFGTVVLAVGGVAYAGDGNDQGGTRAWAQVNPNGGSPVLVKAKGFISVSSPSTGVYCLKPAAGVNLSNSAPVATQEVNLSSTLGLVTVRRSGIPNTICPVNDQMVTTWDAAKTADFVTVDTVGFDVVVP
jgi:hypothetical protein